MLPVTGTKPSLLISVRFVEGGDITQAVLELEMCYFVLLMLEITDMHCRAQVDGYTCLLLFS